MHFFIFIEQFFDLCLNQIYFAQPLLWGQGVEVPTQGVKQSNSHILIRRMQQHIFRHGKIGLSCGTEQA